MPAVVAVLGDSIVANGRSPAPSFYATRTAGFSAWAEHFVSEAFEHPFLNFGVGGEDTAEIAARVGDVVAASPDYCVVCAGSNDIPSSGADTAQIITSLRTIYTALKLGGVRVLAMTIPPRDGAGAERLPVRNEVNAWIRAASETYLVDTLIDLEPTVAAGGYWRAGYSDDGTHPTPLGALRMGRLVAEALQAKYSIPAPLPHGAAALVENGALLGVSGELSGGAVGEVADGWQLHRNPASVDLVVAGEKEPHPSIISDRQVVRVSGTSPADEPDARLWFVLEIAHSYVAGDELQATAEVSVREAQNLSHVALRFELRGDTDLFSVAGERPNAVTEMPRVSWDGTLTTPVITTPTNPTVMKVLLDIRPIAASDINLECAISSVRIRKVN